jgi:hypothetical protein
VLALLHTANGALLQLPGQSMSSRQIALPFWQFPDAGHCRLLVQTWFVLLQCPPMTAQSLESEQSLLSRLHWPTGPQSDGCMQEALLMLQAPASVGHCALFVQAALLTLQVPGSGVHTGAAQLATGVQGFSGSGGSKLQPSGLYVTGPQTGGAQVCVPGRLQTWGNGPLHTCALLLQTWFVPLHCCALEPRHFPPVHVGPT